MLNPWLILGSVAFTASFAVSLLMTRDLGGSLIAGSSALAIALVTAATVNSYHNRSVDSRIAGLKQQIRQLQRRRTEEQQAVAELTAEKERVVLSLNSMQQELRQRQLPGDNPYARPAPSWNLGAAPETQGAIALPPDGSAEIQPEFHPAALTQFITEAAATKQKITASLNHLQSELTQLNAQVSEQRQKREQLMQELQHLHQQKQQLTATTQGLTEEVAELERWRQELDQYVVYVEAKKQELEAGTNPLQKALKQLQSQITALQEELRSLEGQVTLKRQEKAALEQDLAQAVQVQAARPLQQAVQMLETQKAELEQELATLRQAEQHAIALQQTLPELNQQNNQLQQQKRQLEAELAHLHQQHTQAATLQADLQQLQQQKSQIERELASLKQQATQVQSAQAQAAQNSLQKLEKQIRDRRQEKESLERHITQLQAQKTALRNQATPPPAMAISPVEPTTPTPNGKNGNGKVVVERPAPRPKGQPAPSADPITESAEPELPALWAELMVQLPEYELEALKAIAQESNPTRILNRIAEDNFTTSDDMINSINQSAAEIVGVTVIKVRGASPPSIQRDHLRTIKKLIETYEYLTE
ncbi:MAG: hypothetical protein NW220_00450 [Leptolyngbyaceae cyanobacterium bins.349]|nr:hypothetical protein [Leptolyngbyaceae cyanobacterium bins.349]